MSAQADPRAILPERLRVFFRLARERYNILLRRLAGAPPPWTSNRWMRDYHCCNVFRDDDGASVFIMEQLVQRSSSPWAAAVAGRLVNREDSLGALFRDGELVADWREQLQAVSLNCHAYKINVKGGLWNKAGVADLIGRAFEERHWWPREQLVTLREAAGILHAFGVGEFVAFQAAHDLKGSSALLAEPLDQDQWTFAGPGATRGALRLLGFDFGEWARRNVQRSGGAREEVLEKRNDLDRYLGEEVGVGQPPKRRKSAPARVEVLEKGQDMQRFLREEVGVDDRKRPPLQPDSSGTRPGSIKDSHVGRALADGAGTRDRQGWTLAVAHEVLAASRLHEHWPASWPKWHLAEVQNWLCEFDKLNRWQEIGPGNARRFRGPAGGGR